QDLSPDATHAGSIGVTPEVGTAPGPDLGAPPAPVSVPVKTYHVPGGLVVHDPAEGRLLKSFVTEQAKVVPHPAEVELLIPGPVTGPDVLHEYVRSLSESERGNVMVTLTGKVAEGATAQGMRELADYFGVPVAVDAKSMLLRPGVGEALPVSDRWGPVVEDEAHRFVFFPEGMG